MGDSLSCLDNLLVIAHNFMKSRSCDGLAAKGLTRELFYLSYKQREAIHFSSLFVHFCTKKEHVALPDIT